MVERKKINDHESESITENGDIISNIINKDKTDISNISEKIIKEKIKKSITDEYEMKKSPKIKHQRSKSSFTSSHKSNTIMINTSGYLKAPINNNKQFISIDSIYSVSSSDSSSTCNLKKIPLSKPRLLHRRSSTTESGLDFNSYSNSINEKSSPPSSDVFLALKNNTQVNSNPFPKKLNKLEFPNQIFNNDINDVEKLNKRNIYVRKLNIKSHTFNTSRDFNDLNFINNKKDNILIPHPPLEPIPTQDDSHRPTSVPIIRRRMYKKK
ncbi:hypothetical protein PIROE2DRAFT_64509 [Piromyces sp. E2]|nr:hypothetical protein PIROE2DRAFT_64509 [Piromyces sp. E2]|eukprot:OUM58296.1 hypothetical protein PIROE2DRAFT_64509 [Piromyces sp. E2]